MSDVGGFHFEVLELKDTQVSISANLKSIKKKWEKKKKGTQLTDPLGASVLTDT